MPFLDKTDVLNYIDSEQLDQLTGADDSIITDAILDSEELLKDYLSPRYDMATELTQTAGDRNRSLLRHGISLTLYFLFQRIAADMMPESREIQYSQAIDWLKNASRGEIQVDLTENDAVNSEGFTIRWGSKTKRGPFNW